MKTEIISCPLLFVIICDMLLNCMHNDSTWGETLATGLCSTSDRRQK